MTKAQLEELVKSLESENAILRARLESNRNAGRKPTILPRHIERMKQLREEGKSYADIGHILGVSSTAVFNALKKDNESAIIE